MERKGKTWGDLWRDRVFTLSNFLSVFRVFLLPIFYLCLREYAAQPEQIFYLGYAVVLTFLAVLSDFLDGFLARLLQQESTLGRYLDPVCDKIVTVVGLGLVAYFFQFPEWILAIYIFREIIGVWLGMFLYLNRGLQGRPNLWGKMGVGLVAFSVSWYILIPYFRWKSWEAPFLYNPEISAYLLLFVLGAGSFAYLVQYWGILFFPEKIEIDLEDSSLSKKFRKL